jgi:hypothetical protein
LPFASLSVGLIVVLPKRVAAASMTPLRVTYSPSWTGVLRAADALTE